MKHNLAEVRLQEAMERMRSRRSDETQGNPVVSLGDALSALYELEEHFRATLGAAYFTRRDASPDGRALAGLMYVRGS